MHGDDRLRCDAVIARFRGAVLGALALGTTGCGPSLQAKAVKAMDGCLAVRNAPFMAGRAAEALATPLPAEVDSLATRTAYSFGFRLYQSAVDAADTQAELTCAMELASHYEDDQVRRWLRTFLHHPDPPVAQHAQRLLERQLARIGKASAAAP